MTLTLDDLKLWPRQELTYTLECSGNASWAGASLVAILDEVDVLDDGIEVVFYGSDSGEETVREQTFTQNFARSMSLADAMSPYNLLCYEMNGETLPQPNGYPLRLNVQPAMDDPMIANKVTYWESNGQVTRQVAIPA